MPESTRNGHNYNKNNNYKFTETTQLLNQENHNNRNIKGSRVIPEMIDTEVKVKDRSEVHFVYMVLRRNAEEGQFDCGMELLLSMSKM